MEGFNERLLVINSLICGHLLVLWAMMLNTIAGHTTAVVAGAIAIFLAWLLPIFTKEGRAVISSGAIFFTIMAWIGVFA